MRQQLNNLKNMFDEIAGEMAITLDGHDPLKEGEEIVYDALHDKLRIGKDFSSLTDAQKFSAARVIHKQGYVKNALLDGATLMLRFDHILIGIEPDGYAHS